jgi:hypothetical protein
MFFCQNAIAIPASPNATIIMRIAVTFDLRKTLRSAIAASVTSRVSADDKIADNRPNENSIPANLGNLAVIAGMIPFASAWGMTFFETTPISAIRTPIKSSIPAERYEDLRATFASLEVNSLENISGPMK